MVNDEKILEYALQQGEAANCVEKVATTADGVVYALSLLDASGFPMPVGLPCLVIARGENLRHVTGEGALHLLSSIDLEE